MPLPEHPAKVAGLCAEELEGLDEVIYVRPEDGASYSLNMTAASVLEWCDGKNSRQQISGLLYDAMPREQRPDRAQLEADVEAILQGFVEHGLIYSANDS